MDSRVTVRRMSERTAQSETTGEEVPIWDDLYVDHPFRLGGAERGGSGTRAVTVGGVEMQLASRVGHFPHDTYDLADGDLIEITWGENYDTVLRIVEADWQDQSTARRVPVVAADRPEEWP